MSVPLDGYLDKSGQALSSVIRFKLTTSCAISKKVMFI